MAEQICVQTGQDGDGKNVKKMKRKIATWFTPGDGVASWLCWLVGCCKGKVCDWKLSGYLVVFTLVASVAMYSFCEMQRLIAVTQTIR